MGTSHQPQRTLKGHAPPMARLSHKSPERKGLRRSRPRGHPKQGATQRARAADSHHARWSTQGHKALTKHKVSSKASAQKAIPPIVQAWSPSIRGCHRCLGGGRARFFVLDLSPAITTSPFHIPTDIVAVSISYARYNIAEHTK
jgi:hypothetical protein